jgi:hypothetical protein
MMRTAEANRILAPVRHVRPTPGLRSALENATTLATGAILAAAGLDPERTYDRDRKARRLVHQALYSRACRSGLYAMGHGYALFDTPSGMRPDFDSSDSFTAKESGERIGAKDLLERELARYQSEPHPEADAAAAVTSAEVALKQSRDRRYSLESRRKMLAEDVAIARAQLAALEARHDKLVAEVAMTVGEIATAETALAQAQQTHAEVAAGARLLEAEQTTQEDAEDARLAELRAQREAEAAAQRDEALLAQAAEATRQAEERRDAADELRALGRRVLSVDVVVPTTTPTLPTLPLGTAPMPLAPADDRHARRRRANGPRELP